jgi:hypothetical protein
VENKTPIFIIDIEYTFDSENVSALSLYQPIQPGSQLPAVHVSGIHDR